MWCRCRVMDLGPGGKNSSNACQMRQLTGGCVIVQQVRQVQNSNYRTQTNEIVQQVRQVQNSSYRTHTNETKRITSVKMMGTKAEMCMKGSGQAQLSGSGWNKKWIGIACPGQLWMASQGGKGRGSLCGQAPNWQRIDLYTYRVSLPQYVTKECITSLLL